MLRRLLAPSLLHATRSSSNRHLISQISRILPASRVPALPTQPLRIAARSFASKSSVDEQIEDIQDQYATAKDEFEIAMEETEKMSVYAQDDRNAAREEFDKLREMFDKAVDNEETGEEVRNRISGRIRELERAVNNMEELAQNQD